MIFIFIFGHFVMAVVEVEVAVVIVVVAVAAVTVVAAIVVLGVRYLIHWPLFDLLYQPRMTDNDDCGEVGGMSGRGNLSTRRKPAPVLLCPLQIAHDLTWARTQATMVGSQQLTA
jgi:hypothetical protein